MVFKTPKVSVPPPPPPPPPPKEIPVEVAPDKLQSEIEGAKKKRKLSRQSTLLNGALGDIGPGGGSPTTAAATLLGG